MPDTTHLQRNRQEMPATLKQIYLNTGTFGPLPTSVIQTMQPLMRGDDLVFSGTALSGCSLATFASSS